MAAVTQKTVGLVLKPRGFERLSKNLDKLPTRVRSRISKRMILAAQFVRVEIINAIRTRLKSRTGALLRSWKVAPVIIEGSNRITTGVFSELPYAGIHDSGEPTIKPKTVKNLPIPLTPKAEKLWPRDWPEGELTFVISKKGNKLLFAEGKPQYVLKPSVKLKGTGYLKAARDASEDDVRSAIDTGIEEAIEEMEKT